MTGEKIPANAPEAKVSASLRFGQHWIARYAMAMGAVAAAFLLRQGIVRIVGGDLPPYITFYPTVMFVALLAGLGPGLLATAGSVLLAVCFILVPHGVAIERLHDAAGLALFSGMGLFMSVVAELYRRSRYRLEEMVAERTAALCETNALLTEEIEDRRQAEETLRRSKEEWENTFNSVPDLIAILDNQHRVVRMNRAMAQRLGIEVGQCVGLRCYEAIHGTKEPPVSCPHSMTLADGREHEVEVHEELLGGDFLVTTTPLLDADGLMVGTAHVARDISARKQVESALLDSERALLEAQQVARVGSYFYDIPVNRWTSSAVLDDIFGIDTGFDRTVESWINLVHPDQRAEMLAYLQDIFEQHRPFDREYRIIRADDETVRWVHGHGRVKYDLNGAPLHLIGTIQDITGRKLAEEAQRASEARFSTVYHSSPVGIGISRLSDGKFLDVNDAFLAIYGFTSEEVLGHTATELGLWLPEERSWLIRELERQGRVQNVEMTFNKKSGETGNQLVSVEMIELGGEKCILGLLNDITERKRAEEALLLSEQRFQTLAAATFEGVAISEQGRYVDVNDQFAHLLGYEPAELIGLEVAATIPPEDHERVLVNIRNGIESKFDHEMICKDGSRRFVEAHGQTIHQQGRQIRLTAVHDITERKRYEAELLKAREAADAASRAKSQFLANMSHELRTPMAGLLGMLQLALDEDLPPVPRGYLETTLNSANSLLRILNDILDMARFEAGKLIIVEKPFSLKRCITESVDIIIPEMRRKGLEFALSIAENMPDEVSGDQVRLRQVLINLIGNSVKFTEGGKVEVRITAGGTTPDRKREITFAVTDTGIGIPDDKKELLFQAFSQVDASHSRSFGGTGLGLAISREIVGLMGGTIGFESKEGVGSTFSFTIPLECDVPENDVLPAARSLSPETTAALPVEGKMPRLLYAEDDPTIREFFGLMLKRANYQVDFAEDGLKAVEMWEKAEYDLVLMDIQMPRLNGFEATHAIRDKERARGGHTLIVAVTAHAFKEDEERCLAAGMDAYISKPINFKKSIQLIGELIRPESRKL